MDVNELTTKELSKVYETGRGALEGFRSDLQPTATVTVGSVEELTSKELRYFGRGVARGETFCYMFDATKITIRETKIPQHSPNDHDALFISGNSIISRMTEFIHVPWSI